MSSNIDSMKSIRLGEVLINEGFIDQEQLQEALDKQKESKGKRLGDLLVEMGFVSEHQKLLALGKRCNLPIISIDAYAVNVEAVEKIPRNLADQYKLIAIDIRNNSLLIALNDPLNFFALEDIRQVVKMPIELCLDNHKSIERAIQFYYSEVSTRRAVSEVNLKAQPIAPVVQEIAAAAADDAPVVKLLHSLLVMGYNTNASDIHIEPYADMVSVRIRVDGTIVDYTQLSQSIHQSLIARIKILADLDIAEKRIPQDGHFRILNTSMDLNIRVSLVPTVYGEKAVLRYLSTHTRIDHDQTFGMSQSHYQKMLTALSSPHGIVYITGPTGSGKTTTLYMMLEYLAQRLVNIATIEDPVERNIRRVNQMQVNNAAGLTFDIGLRAILRQDPDIIMVGETRDAETASISVRAAITGHLVLSTLHTNDAVSSIVRLHDMGVPPYLIANSVVAVVAQRLVRKVCNDCRYTYDATEQELQLIGVNMQTLARGKGCPQCNQTGYRGRIAVHEILLVDRAMRKMISQMASSDELFDYAHEKQGLKTLRESATELLEQGITTIDELVKTAYYEGI